VSPTATVGLKTSTAHERRFEPNAIDLSGVGHTVPVGAGQANEIFVGIEIWHSVAHPTDEKARASSCGGPDERRCERSFPSASARSVYLIRDFVTSL